MADGPGGSGRRRRRPRLLLLLALAWLCMLLPAALSFSKQLACASGWCDRQANNGKKLLLREASSGGNSSSTPSTPRATKQVCRTY